MNNKMIEMTFCIIRAAENVMFKRKIEAGRKETIYIDLGFIKKKFMSCQA